MRGTVKPVLVAIAAVVGAVLLTITSAFTSAFAWGALALIVPGTGTPDPSVPLNYENHVLQYYVNPNFVNPPAASPCGTTGLHPGPGPLHRPVLALPLRRLGRPAGREVERVRSQRREQADPGYADEHDGTQPIVIFGYSQGATVASMVKSQIAQASPDGKIDPDTTFVFIGDPNRPTAACSSGVPP